MKLLQIKVNGKIYFAYPPMRILEPHEFRNVPGKLVKGMHLGKPLIDLGIMVACQETRNSKGFVYGDHGFLTDEIVSKTEIDDEKITVFPKLAWDQRRSYSKGLVEYKGKRCILINDSLNRHWQEEIEAELKARNWL